MFASITKTSVSALKRANFIRATCIAPTRMFSGVWNEAGAYTHPEGAKQPFVLLMLKLSTQRN